MIINCFPAQEVADNNNGRLTFNDVLANIIKQLQKLNYEKLQNYFALDNVIYHSSMHVWADRYPSRA